MKKEETTNHTERSNLWNSIYELVKELPRANVEGDAVDYSSLTTSLEKLFASQQSDRREELKGIVKWMCDENISRFCDPDRIVEEYLKSHPEPAKVTDEMIERWAKEYCFENGYSLKQDIALVRDALKAMRARKIK